MTTIGDALAPTTSFAPYLLEQTLNANRNRARRLSVIGDDVANREAECALCARDVVHWIDTYVKTYDPRFVSDGCPAVLPFVLFPRQVEFLRWLAERERMQENGAVEKSREVGATWLIAAWAVHGLVFRPGWKLGVTSRSEGAVDKIGDTKSIFERIRFILRGLPKWMVSRGGIRDKFCTLANDANGASITGEVGDNVGRCDRCSVYVVDEAAYIEHADRVNAALSQTTRCQIDISTANGTGCSYYKRLRAMQERQVFRFHWRDDIRKNTAWYEAEKIRIGDARMIAQELDINHAAAAVGLAFPVEYFGDHIWFDDWPKDMKVRVMYLDPSRGKGDKTSDYSAWCMLQIDQDYHCWFDCDMSNSRPTEAMEGHAGMRSMVGDGLALFRDFRPHAVLIEANQFQIEVALACRRVWAARGVPNPAIYHVTHTVGKDVRIMTNLSTILAHRRFHARRTPGGIMMVDQTREYSPDPKTAAPHDDGPDAAAGAIEMANYLLFPPDGDAGPKIHVLRG